MDHLNKYRELEKQNKELQIQKGDAERLASKLFDEKFKPLDSENESKLKALKNELVDEFCKKFNVKVYTYESYFQFYYQTDNEDVALKFFNSIEEKFVCYNFFGTKKIFQLNFEDDYDYDKEEEIKNVIQYKEVEFKYIFFKLQNPEADMEEIENLIYEDYKLNG